jgi:ATP-dependent RNA helicase RhlE
MKQVLVFVRMKRDANKLARELERDGINTQAIHSDRSQGEREQALSDFKEGRATVLVATDIAARGLDIEQLPYVINYELPYTPEDYVHRIGRTGRAGMSGEAISFMAADETKLLGDIEKLLKRPIPRLELPAGFDGEDRQGGRGREEHGSRGRRQEREREPSSGSSARSEREPSTGSSSRTEREPSTGSTSRSERQPSTGSTSRTEREPSRGSASRGEREPSRSSRGARPEREHRPSSHLKAHPHKQPSASDFDFTKPYEPSAASAAKKEGEEDALPSRGRPKRQTAALLGGTPEHRKSHK